jgi:hypothetical protein
VPPPNASACRTTSSRNGRSRAASPGWAAITASYRAASRSLSRAARARTRAAADGLPPVPSDPGPAEQLASRAAPAAEASRLLLRGPGRVRGDEVNGGTADVLENSYQTNS